MSVIHCPSIHITHFSKIYEQMPNEKGTTLYSIQKQFQSIFGFTLPMFHGRGILNCWSLLASKPSLLICRSSDNFGLMPYRRTIVSVFGRPIHVQKTEKVTMDMVLEIHSQYVAELQR